MRTMRTMVRSSSSRFHKELNMADTRPSWKKEKDRRAAAAAAGGRSKKKKLKKKVKSKTRRK